MTHLDALLLAIHADPGADLPRLVYADALDDAGQADRAEFIRLQVDIAAMPPRRLSKLADRYNAQAQIVLLGLTNPYWQPPPGNGTSTGTLFWDEPNAEALAPLQARERELLGANWRTWCHPFDHNIGCLNTATDWHSTAEVMARFHRGFIAAVHAPLRRFYGFEGNICASCAGFGVLPDPETGSDECRRCEGGGRPFYPGFARDLFRLHPVVEVMLSDKVPEGGEEGLFGFYSPYSDRANAFNRVGHFDGEPDEVVTEATADHAADLPLRLWELLGDDDDPQADRDVRYGSGWKLWNKRETANARLASAALDFGREMAR